MQIVSPRRRRLGAFHGVMPHIRKQERLGHNRTMEGYGHGKRKTVNILFKGKNYERTASMIKKIWKYRKELLKPP